VISAIDYIPVVMCTTYSQMLTDWLTDSSFNNTVTNAQIKLVMIASDDNTYNMIIMITLDFVLPSSLV